MDADKKTLLLFGGCMPEKGALIKAYFKYAGCSENRDLTFVFGGVDDGKILIDGDGFIDVEKLVAFRWVYSQSEEFMRIDDALGRQEGGNHYKNMKIQPVEYITANNLGFCEGNVIKYVSRHNNKNGAQDIKKAIHFLEIILAQQYGE